MNLVEAVSEIPEPGAHLAVGSVVGRDIRFLKVCHSLEGLTLVALIRDEDIRKLRVQFPAAFLLTMQAAQEVDDAVTFRIPDKALAAIPILQLSATDRTT